MAHTVPRAAQRAQVFLKEAIKEARRTPSGRLPTLSELAALAGVGRVSMAAAVRESRNNGEIFTRTGSGIHASGAVCRSPDSRGPLWMRIRQRLLQDMYSGVFPAYAPLPSPRRLSLRYQANPQTITRALRALAADGILDDRLRSIRIAGIRSTRMNASLLLIAMGDPYGNLEESSPWVRRNLESLERQCMLNGLRLEYLLWQRQSGGRTIRPHRLSEQLSQLSNAGSALGSLVWTQSFPDTELAFVLEYLGRFNRPAAFLDESGERFRRTRRTRIPALTISYDQYRAGYQMGAHLQALGHRHVAFLVAGEESDAIGQRRAGISAAFSEAGFPRAISVLSGQQHSTHNFNRNTNAISGFQLVPGLLERCGIRAGELPGRIAWYSGALKLAIDRLSTIATYHDRVADSIRAALSIADATACVGATDQMALECLRTRNTLCRNDISVCGFDDSVEARMCGLTSYNFNGEDAMRAMVRHSIAPDISSRHCGRNAHLSVTGYVVSRASSHRPASAEADNK